MSDKKEYTKENVEITDLTKLQQKFVEAYLREDVQNQTEAAKIAGYSTPASGAHACMSSDRVKAMIEKRFEDMSMSRNELLKELSQVARTKDKSVYREKIGALKELARRYDDFKDRKEITVSKEEKEKELDRLLGYDDIAEEEEVVLEPMEEDG